MKKIYTLKAMSLVVMLVIAFAINAQTTTWYSINSGEWTDPENWTLDPAGAVYNNPDLRYPNTINDNIFILSGKTISMNGNNMSCGILTVRGVLDLGSTSGHSFAEIRGNGRIEMEADNFPLGDATRFTTSLDRGTAVYKGNSFTVSTPRTFYNLFIEMEDGQALTLDHNLTVNNELQINNGHLKVGETRSCTIDVMGRITVQSESSFTVAPAVFTHYLNAYGDIVNNGIIRFTNLTQPVYNAPDNSGHIVFTAMGTLNRTLTASGQTDLSRLVINKGTNETPLFTINSGAIDNFRLFGQNNTGNATRALRLQNGTLRLLGDMFIPTLTEGVSNFIIEPTAGLWIASSGVTVNITALTNEATTVGGVTGTGVDVTTGGNQSVQVEGRLRITAGVLNTNTHGIIFGHSSGGSVLQIGGGTVNTPGIRDNALNNSGTYLQTSGTVNLFGDIGSAWGFSTLYLRENSSFEMTGGTINILDAAQAGNNAIRIESGADKFNVTGGTVNINRNTPASAGADYNIYSTVPFFTFSILAPAVGFNTNVILQRELTILGNLTIQNRASLDVTTANHDLKVRGNLRVDNGGTYNARNNTTHLIGNINATIQNLTATGFNIYNINIEKDAGGVYEVGLSNNLTIPGHLTLTRGNFNHTTRNVTVNGNITLIDGSILATTGTINLNGPSVLYSEKGKEQSFGILNLNSGISFASNARVKEVRFNGNYIVNIGRFNLEIENSNYSSSHATFNVNRKFMTNGLASDGGLTLPLTFNGTTNYGASTIVQFFPIGTPGGTGFAYVDAQNTPVATNGSITIIPVNDKHPATKEDDKDKVLDYYWKVSNSNLNGLDNNNIRYRFIFDGTVSGSVNKGAVMYESEWYENGSVVGSSVVFQFGNFPYTSGDFTAGNQSYFNKPRIVYSKASGAWNLSTTWTLSPTHSGANTTAPGVLDVAIIGGAGSTNHKVTVGSTDRSAQVTIKGKSDTGISAGDPPTLEVLNTAKRALYSQRKQGQRYYWDYIEGNDFKIIQGNGRILISGNNLPSGDYTSFLNNTEAVFEYAGAINYTLPAASIARYEHHSDFGIGIEDRVLCTLDTYPNLHFSGLGTKTGANLDLNILGNLSVNDATFELSPAANGNIVINQNVNINTGNIVLPNLAKRTVNIKGNLEFTGTGDFRTKSGASAIIHDVLLFGNLLQGNGDIDFSTQNAKANIYFTGDQSVTYSKTGTGTTLFNRVYINKPIGQSAHFTSGFTLNGPTNDATKALVLQSGTTRLSSPDIKINLSTGGDDFRITSANQLIVDNGSEVYISGNNTGLWLDGKLIIDSGVAKFDGNGTTNNYIEYTPSGNAEIIINGSGQLTVGTQIRRSLSTESGILKYAQNGATSNVVVGTNPVPAGSESRAIFEILNNGSSFTLASGAQLTIANGKGGTFPDFYFNPELLIVDPNGTFYIDQGPSTSEFNIYPGKPFANLHIKPGVTASIVTLPITINGNLTVDGSFNATALDVTIKGNLINNGNYLSVNNTTFLSGTNEQIIGGNGNTVFYDFEKNGGNSILKIEDKSITINNDANLLSGSVHTNNYDVQVKGDLLIEQGVTTQSNTGSKGFVMSGDLYQRLTGSGTFGILTIDNINGVVVPTQSSSVNISQALRLSQGILDIGRNMLVIESDATIEAANPFSNTNMIQTNLSFTDTGVRKNLVTGGLAQPYVLPIGSFGKYTPATLEIDNVTSDNGYILIKSANEYHVTVLDPDNVLHYHWTVSANKITNLTGKISFQALASDVKYTSEAMLDSYIAARILNGETEWQKLENGLIGGVYYGYDKDNHRIIYPFNNNNYSEISGDYTAGAFDAIPSKLPVYITVNNGNWNTLATWRVYNPETGEIGAQPLVIPRNCIIYVTKDLTVTTNNQSVFRTNISEDGKIILGTTVNHRLGNVTGKGLIRLNSGSLPAGVYDDFFSAEGGTIEFTGGTYDVLGEKPEVNNLIFSGSGTKRLPNNDLLLNGSLIINPGTTLSNPFSKTIEIKKDFLNNSNFRANGGTIILSGGASQTIGGTIGFSGAVTNSNALFNLVIDNPYGITLQNNMDILNELTLLNGVVRTSPTAILTMRRLDENVIIGTSSTRYISGPLRKNLNVGSTYTYPIGRNERHGEAIVTPRTKSGLWMVEYVNSPHPNRNSLVDVAFVSNNEYWNITAPDNTGVADVSVRWDGNSGVNPQDTTIVLAFYQENTPPLGWTQLQNAVFVGDNSDAGFAITENQSFSVNAMRQITFGATEIPTYTWTGSFDTDWFKPVNWNKSLVPSASSLVTIPNTERKPIISGVLIAQTNDLIIQSGAILTLGNGTVGGKLTVNGHLTITGELVLDNKTGTNGLSSFINKGLVTGNARVKLQVPGNRWYYLSSPFGNTNFGDFGAPAAEGVSLYVYRNNAWNNTVTLNPSGTLNDLEGILVKYTAAGFEFNKTGQLFSGTKARSVSRNWHLFGNPYPSFINWQSGAGWSRPDISATIWYRTEVDGILRFITYNRAAAVGARAAFYPDEENIQNEEELALIPPMQAVWIRSWAASTISVGDAARVHGVNSSYLKSSSINSDADIIRIVASNSYTKDGAVIYFSSGSAEAMENTDSEKRFNDSQLIPEVYTRIGTTAAAINGLTPLNNNSRTIPLSVRNRVNNDVTLNFDIDRFNPIYSIYLEDKVNSQWTNLRETNAYTYTPAVLGDVHNRFVIHISYVPTSVVNPEENETSTNGITITGVRGKVIVIIDSQLLSTEDGLIEVYTMEGQKVSETITAASETLISLPRVDAMFVVKVIAGGVTKTEKVYGKY